MARLEAAAHIQARPDRGASAVVGPMSRQRRISTGLLICCTAKVGACLDSRFSAREELILVRRPPVKTETDPTGGEEKAG